MNLGLGLILLFFAFVKLLTQYQVVLWILAVVVVMIVVTSSSRKDAGSVLRSTLPSFPPTSPAISGLPGTPPFNRDIVKSKLEELYFQKKLTKELFDELVKVLLGSPAPAVLPVTTSVPLNPAEPIKPIPTSTPTPVPMARSSTPVQPTTTSSSTTQKPSGFFSSENIKTMLVSGCALFVLSAYLFVRSYWQAIPDFLKFSALLFATVGIHGIGRVLMGKKETPKTAETLLILSALLVPFNFYAGNYLILDGAFGAYASWAAGAAVMFVLGLFLASAIPTVSTGIVIALGFIGTFVFGGLNADIFPASRCFVMAFGTLLLAVASLLVEMKKEIKEGLFYVVNAAAATVIFWLATNPRFLTEGHHLAVGFSLLFLGVVYAIQARITIHTFAYGAGLCFAGALAVFLHRYEVPVYKYGLYFIPASILATLRAWTFERSGKKDLAAPYFHLGQLAIAGSLIAVFPYFSFYVESGFATLLVMLTIGTAAYALNGVLYRNPTFTYMSGSVLLFITWACATHYHMAFVDSVLLMASAGTLLVFAGLVSGLQFDDLLGQPLSVLGLGCVSICVALLAGKWGADFFNQGSLETGLSLAQLKPAIWVGVLGTLAYSIVAAMRRQTALVFPALMSATITYFFVLEKMACPVDLLNTSWIVASAMMLFYLTQFIKWENLSRCFAVWGEIVFVVIALSALVGTPDIALSALLVCTISFLPGLFFGRVDVTSCLLGALYVMHYLWFGRTMGWNGADKWFSYGAQLLFVNCGVIFIRTLLTAWRPNTNILPFRVAAILFSIISLITVLNDRNDAWQIYLAYGILALIVSAVHYQGRGKAVGTALLLLSYELALWSFHVELTEAYTVPAGLYLLISGYFYRENKDLRNLLYIFAQVFLFAPTFQESLGETWELHGVFLGVESLAVMLFGIHERNKCLAMGGLIVLMLNGFIQSAQIFAAIPRWVYLAFGGVTLVGLGGLFEFQREKLIAARKQMAGAFEGWD